MVHSDITRLIHIVKRLALNELKRAIKAHGGYYVFGKEDPTVIVGDFVYSDGTEDIILTRVVLDEDKLRFYGVPAHYSAEEQLIDYIDPSQYGYILDVITPTEDVKGVRSLNELFETSDTLQEVLLGGK